MKKRYACGLLAVLLLATWLVPSSAQAGTKALEWTKVDKPGEDEDKNIVVSPSEVSEIAVGSDGVLYVTDSENSKVYRSLNAGVTWEDITDYLVDAGAGLPAGKVAVAPDKPGIMAVVTDGGTEVYLSTDGGIDWTDTGVPSLEGTIQAIAISEEYTQGGEDYREIAIGTAVWGDGITSGEVWIRQFRELWTSWQNQNLTIDPSHAGGEVSALAYSPKYLSDATILAVASTSGDVGDDYKNKTWLCLLERDVGVWNTPTGYPVEITSAGDALGVSWIHSSLALPSNYSGDEAESRQLFVSYDQEPDANDDVYWLNDDDVHRLNADGGNTIDISSIAYHGTLNSGKLLAGDTSPVPGSLTVQVRRTKEPFGTSPAWHLSEVPPTGPGNAKVGWSPDGKIAYCGTGQTPGVELDESALSASLDGDKWRQLALMDTVIQLADIAASPDGESLFITTYNPYGPEGIWHSAGGPLGENWERLLTMDTCCNAVILRLSPNYDDDYTIYAAEVGGNQLAVTHNRGNSWKWCREAPGPIIDIAVGDAETVYIAMPGGYVGKSTYGILAWRVPVETDLSNINMLAIIDEEKILAGGRNGDVSYSVDGGESFTRIREIIGSGSGDVQVIADASYSENDTIYAATNLPDEGIWRWTIGISSQWQQIDQSITDLESGQRIGGLAVGSEGTLYALRLEPATDASSGITRSLNPLEVELSEVEFDLANDLLPEGTTFDPTAVFPGTIPYLKLSGDAEQNELWTIDTANHSIYRYEDSLCKVGPNPVTPQVGDVIPVDSSGHIVRLILSWEELDGATKYEAAIYQGPDAAQSLWSGITTGNAVNVTGDSELTKLIGGEAYYWRVRAIELVKSQWSEMRSFTPALGGGEWNPFMTSSMYPGNVAPAPGAANVPLSPAFQWNAADWATNYEFVLSDNPDFTSSIVSFRSSDALSATVYEYPDKLSYSTTYYWKVRAIQLAAGGKISTQSTWGAGIFTATAKPAEPAPPVVVEQAPPAPPDIVLPHQTIPAYIWVIIAIGGALIITVVVLLVRIRRVI